MYRIATDRALGVCETAPHAMERQTMTSDAAAGQPHPELLRQLDESHITRTHWKIMFISGMGFFTDAYDLFIIGVVMSLLKQQWQISPVADGLVTSTALLAAAIGAVLFGRIADMLGRKRIY